MSKKIFGIFLIFSLIFAPLISSLSTNENKLLVTKNSISDCIEVYKAYANVAYNPSGEEGLYGFELFPFGNFTYLGPGGSGNFLTGACFVPPCYIYFSEYGTGIIYALDILTLVFHGLGGGGSGLNGLDYDDESGYLYAVDSYGLYQINITTGEQTYIGGWGSGYMMITIAIYNGICYGLDLTTDSIYIIDLESAELTLVGSTGLNLNYAQDMGFDKDNGILYLAAYTTTGQFYQVNITTGECTLLGNFPNGLEVSAFAIIYGNIPPYVPCDFHPEDGEENVPVNVTLCWKGGDYNSEDNVTYDVYFGPSFPPSKKSWNQTETCYSPGYDLNLCNVYYWQIVTWDNHGLCTKGPGLTFKTWCGPQPPGKPIIKGPKSGKIGIEYVYTFNSTDNDSEYISYVVDWGDKSPIEQIGPSPSGVEVNASHTWRKSRTYIIRVRAKDEYDLVSPLGLLEVTMSRSKSLHNTFFLSYLNKFPLLYRLLGVIV